MSESEKLCVFFKALNEKGFSGQNLYYCEERDLVLGERAKVCLVCDDYKPGKEDYDPEIYQEIIDYLSGKRKRQTKRWTKKKQKKKATSKKKKNEIEEEEEEEEEEESEEEGEDEDETEDEDEEDENVEKKKTRKKKTATKKKSTTTGKKKTTKKKTKSKKVEVKKFVLEGDKKVIYDLIKEKGTEGLLQIELKNKIKMPSGKVSNIINELKDEGLIEKEKVKHINSKNKRPIYTNLLKAIK
ncbi:MAG: helix-turn-helix transcriptional regulator [Promethearchaeota archaeon]